MTCRIFDRLRYILFHGWLTSSITFTVFSVQNVQNVRLVQQQLSSVASETGLKTSVYFGAFLSLVQNVTFTTFLSFITFRTFTTFLSLITFRTFKTIRSLTGEFTILNLQFSERRTLESTSLINAC